MSFDLNAMFDDPRFAEAVALFGATGQHNAGLIDAAKTMQHMKHLKAQQEEMKYEREHKGKKLSLEQQEHESMKGYRASQIEAQSAQNVTARMNAQSIRDQQERDKQTDLLIRDVLRREGLLDEGGTSLQPATPGPSLPAPTVPAPQMQTIPQLSKGPTNAGEAAMKAQVAGPMGADPKAIDREIAVTTADLARVPDPSSKEQLNAYLIDLKQQKAALGAPKALGGSNEQQAKGHNDFQALAAQAEKQRRIQRVFGAIRALKRDPAGFGMIAEGMKPDFETPKLQLQIEKEQRETLNTVADNRRADAAAAIAAEKAEYERTQREAAEREQAAEIAQKQAAADEKRTKVETEARQRDQAKITAQSIINEMRKSYDTLDKRGGIVNSEKGLFNNLPAAVQSSQFGQQIQRITGTANQTERSNLEMARPLLLQSLAQALGMGVRQLDNVKEFEMYLKAATDPTMDVAANKQALDRLEQILTGKALLTIKTPDGEKTMTVEEFKKNAPAALDRSSQFKVIR